MLGGIECCELGMYSLVRWTLCIRTPCNLLEPVTCEFMDIVLLGQGLIWIQQIYLCASCLGCVSDVFVRPAFENEQSFN